MTMTSVSGISSSTLVDYTSSTSTSKTSSAETDFQALQDALDSGDLEAAKSAFETIQNNKPSGPPPGPPPSESGSSSSDSGSDRESDFAALEEALSSGDISAAQTAFETIQSHMAGNSSSQTATASQSVSTDGVGTLLDLVA
jgi:hypothetical protein